MSGPPNLPLLKKGKVKDVYTLDERRLLFYFTDRVSAYDVVLPTPIPRRGEVLCLFASYWFEYLGVPHHMVELRGRREMVVKRLQMIPVECVVRGYVYGSLYERARRGEASLPVEAKLAAPLTEPIFDPTTKAEVGDAPITEQEILAHHWMGGEELSYVKEVSIDIYRKMAERALEAGFILADLKLEFGRGEGGQLFLADSIGPDEFRLWPQSQYQVGKVQESYDKQPIRDWLAQVGYKARRDEAVRQGLPPPTPPPLPNELVEETSQRYILAYETLTGRRLPD